jgi:hypothetical protein
METTMKTTTRRAALVATAGVTAAIGSALAAAPASAAPASAEEPVTILTDVTQTVYCNESRPIGTENGALARITTSCSGSGDNTVLTVTGSIDDTEEDGKSACVSVTWPNGAGYERARDTQDDNIVTRIPSGWQYKGRSVSVHVWTCA